MNNALVQNTKYRRDILRALALFTFTGGLLFCTLNFIRGLYLLAALELAYSLFSIFLWFIIPKTPHLSRWILWYIIPFFIVMMFALSLPATSDAIFVWVLTIPLLAYLLLGRRLGFWVSLIFIFLGIIAYHLRFIDSSNPFSLNAAISINITLSALLVMIIAHVYELNRDKNENRLIELAGTDQLTGLPNRMKLDTSFQHISSLAKRHKIDFTLILIDIDFFKSINDQYGHDVGDEALCYIANFLNKNVRESDFLARFGGEEFALFMTSTEPNQANQHIENIRKMLSQSPFLNGDIAINITLSAGLATYGKDGKNLESLLKKADERLYQAKHNGRNCIVFD
ncbi:GGDEF domain-containing protein [Paraglaciecola marina]|uniref:GGDEF domain-containing protein n=1 Tax=Paraglaciecola marina TaxID=2500157 RepID=UPI00105DCA6C|nr:GGDEF domain-containing protein [Paraglaciecola marina]